MREATKQQNSAVDYLIQQLKRLQEEGSTEEIFGQIITTKRSWFRFYKDDKVPGIIHAEAYILEANLPKLGKSGTFPAIESMLREWLKDFKE